jgi:sugar phosphate isomerase/epimerase
MKRRQFVASCTGLLSLGLTGQSLSRSAMAIEPIVRPKPGKLRLSLAAYSMRKYLATSRDGKKPSSMDLFQFVDFCFENGIPGAELTSYYFPEKVDDAYLMKLKRHCHMRGITISGGAIANDYCQPDSAKLAADLEHTRTWIEHYAKLGAPAIRIFAGKQPTGEDLAVTLKRCAKNCQVACQHAEKFGVMLALENHGGVTAHAKDLLEIVRHVDSPAIGINFDSGNFRTDDDPYSELAKIAPYAVNAQIKVEIHRGGKDEPADLARILNVLRDVGYSGWVALEYEAAEEPKDAIPRYLDQLKKLVS